VIARERGYLYVDFFSADGSVAHLLPRPGDQNNYRHPSAMVALGRGNGSGSWTIRPPAGTEMITAIKASARLFPGDRPEVEQAFDYRQDLQQALDRVLGSQRDGRVTADIGFITVSPRE
jgi:hypothetical protein